jgi:hypothetical protein
MRVRYKTLAAGPDGVFRIGDEAEVTEQLGAALVSGGYADAIGVKAIASVAVQQVKEALASPAPAKHEPAKKTPGRKKG